MQGDIYGEAQAKASTPSDVPPVIPTPHYYLISVFRNNLYFVAVTQSESEYWGLCVCVCMRVCVEVEVV